MQESQRQQKPLKSLENLCEDNKMNKELSLWVTEKNETLIKVNDIIDIVNSFNANSENIPQCREGWNHLLDEILMVSNTYRGFRFAQNAFDPESGEFIDESRRSYFKHAGRPPIKKQKEIKELSTCS